MSGNKITFLQSIKLGAWWFLISAFPIFSISAFFGAIFQGLVYFFPSIEVNSSLFSLVIVILIITIFIFSFNDSFPTEFRTFKITNTKAISYSRIFLNYIWISFISFLVLFLLLNSFELVTFSNDNFVQLKRIAENPFLEFFRDTLIAILILSFTARLIINRNPDCFEFVPIDGDKPVEEFASEK